MEREHLLVDVISIVAAVKFFLMSCARFWGREKWFCSGCYDLSKVGFPELKNNSVVIEENLHCCWNKKDP